MNEGSRVLHPTAYIQRALFGNIVPEIIRIDYCRNDKKFAMRFVVDDTCDPSRMEIIKECAEYVEDQLAADFCWETHDVRVVIEKMPAKLKPEEWQPFEGISGFAYGRYEGD